jgi:hypothetical protein
VATGKAQGRKTKITKRQLREADKQESPDSPNPLQDQESVTALEKEIRRLEAENKRSREQIAALSARDAPVYGKYSQKTNRLPA